MTTLRCTFGPSCRETRATAGALAGHLVQDHRVGGTEALAIARTAEAAVFTARVGELARDVLGGA